MKDAVKLLQYIGIAMIVSYLPRFVYLVKLCSYNCSIKAKDGSKDREKVLHAMYWLILSNVLTIISTIAILYAWGGSMSDFHENLLYTQAVTIPLALWWRKDIKIWIEIRVAYEKYGPGLENNGV